MHELKTIFFSNAYTIHAMDELEARSNADHFLTQGRQVLRKLEQRAVKIAQQALRLPERLLHAIPDALAGASAVQHVLNSKAADVRHAARARGVCLGKQYDDWAECLDAGAQQCKAWAAASRRHVHGFEPEALQHVHDALGTLQAFAVAAPDCSALRTLFELFTTDIVKAECRLERSPHEFKLSLTVGSAAAWLRAKDVRLRRAAKVQHAAKVKYTVKKYEDGHFTIEYTNNHLVLLGVTTVDVDFEVHVHGVKIPLPAPEQCAIDILYLYLDFNERLRFSQ